MPIYMSHSKHSLAFQGSTVDDLFEQHPNLMDFSKNFLRLKRHTVAQRGLLYVGQREMVVTTNNDERIQFLGSEDATTCHIVILHNKKNGKVCLAHLDGVKTNDAVRAMISAVRSPPDSTSEIVLHIFGGFADECGLSKELSNELLEAFGSSPEEVLLGTACITPVNTCWKNDIPFPIIYGVAIDIRNGEIFPACFPDKGPDVELRHVRMSIPDADVLSIYDSVKGQIIIPPFDYQTFPQAELWLQQSDHIILKYLSTSPQQEPADFVANTKKSIRFTIENPSATIFKNNMPRIYNVNSSCEWVTKPL